MPAELNVVVAYVSPDTRDELVAILSRLEGVKLSPVAAQDGQPIADPAGPNPPDVVVVEINGHRDQHLKEIEALKQAHRNVTIFATAREGNIESMRSLLRAGVKDFFPQPLQSQEILMAVTAALSEKRTRTLGEGGRRGRVVAFLNAKGGSGATTLAVNVAHMLAEGADKKVALVDLDLQFGVVALSLDLNPRGNIVEALMEPDRIDPVFIQALTTKYDGTLDVLASPADLSPMEGITADAVAKVIQSLTGTHDVVVVDVPRIFTPWTIGALQLADLILLVIQNSLSTIRDAKLVLNYLPGIGISVDAVELVNNRAMAATNSVPIEKLKETLKKRYIHRVRNDYQVAAQGQDEGVPLARISKHSPLVKDIRALADYILGDAHRDTQAESGGLFSKWLGRGSN